MDHLSKQLNERLKSSTEQIELGSIYKATAKNVLGNKVSNFGANASMEKALQNLQAEISSVSGETGSVSVMDAQSLKRAAGHFGAWLFGQNDPDAPGGLSAMP